MKRLARMVGCACLLALTVQAYPMAVQMASEEALVKNIEAYLADHPKDTYAYLALARVRMNAWAHSTGPGWKMTVTFMGKADELPRFGPWETVMQHRRPRTAAAVMGTLQQSLLVNGDAPAEITPAAVQSLVAGVAACRRGVELDEADALLQLALGNALEELGTAAYRLPADFAWPEAAPLTAEDRRAVTAALAELADAEAAVRAGALKKLEALMPHAAQIILQSPHEDPEVAARLTALAEQYWRRQALPHYRAAYDARIDQDLKAARFDELNDACIGAEAGDRLLAILRETPALAKPGEIQRVREALEAINKKERVAHDW